MQKIITENIGQKVIILLQGDVDASDHRLSRRLNSPQAKHKEFQIWIDCSGIECIKTYGICHFVNQLLVLKAGNKAEITLLNVNDQHLALLHILQLQSAFAIVPNFEVAYQLVQAS